MTYFLNPFPSDFRGNWVLGDRQYSLTFVVPGNYGRDDELVVAYNAGPYDLTGNDADGNDNSVLTIRFAIDKGTLCTWNTLAITIDTGAAVASAVTVTEIVNNLNDNATFSTFFTASSNIGNVDGINLPEQIRIRSKRGGVDLKYYIVSTGAETVLGFNSRAGIADIPSYFDRHTIDNKPNFTDSAAHLIALDPSNSGGASAVDDNIIDNAGLDSSTILEDWEHLRGRSGLFIFKNITVDGSNRITQIIEYQAGAPAGSLAKVTTFSYTGANTNPDQVTEVPYTLQSGDLITP